jgi:copper chaperone CopZ
MKRPMRLASLLLFVLGVAAAPAPSPAFAAEPPAPQQNAALDAFEVRVNGMACPFCAYGIEKKLRALPGTRDVKVDLEAGRATFDAPAGTLSKEQVQKAIKDAGFSPGEITVQHR